MTSQMMSVKGTKDLYEIPFQIIQLRKDIKELCEEIRTKRIKLKELEEKIK